SILDLELLKKHFEGADYVLHQAAIPSVPKSVKDPISSNEANITGTLNVLVAARDCKVKRVVYAASSSAYGDTPTLPKVETMPTTSLSPYALQKLTGEHYCRIFSALYDIETVALRYFNVFGPRQDPSSFYSAVIPKFITAIAKDEQPTIFGDGETSRDFCYISNVVNANLLACTAKGVSGEVFNIACGERTSLLQLVEKISNILGKDIKALHEEERAGDVKHSLADISKAKNMLGYEVLVPFDEGLKLTTDWCKGELK
ncbi:NAD-dependent epimerase/dehydratase family protein, partial [Candidatus Woesearchaeota archaeon]|nr:NAD-dependent epimerase/dehydratase family protein [Candidatus Woesearchaeota archaeon]